MDKFLLAENPMRPDDSGLWIVHLLDPKAIIRCSHGHVEADLIYKHYQYKNADDHIEEWTLSAYHNDNVTQDQIITILDRAWRWFRSYLSKNTHGNN